MSLSKSEAKLKISILNSDVMQLDKLDTIVQFTNYDLPQEIITLIDELWETTKIIGEQVIHVGKIILDQIMKFIKENSHLVIGIAIGAAVGALISMIPWIGSLLAPLATAISVLVGGIAGYRADQGKEIKGGAMGVTQELIMIAKKFFDLLGNIFNALSTEFSQQFEVMQKNHKLTDDEYISALERMKKSPRDRVGVLGELAGIGLGGVAGVGIASTTASAAGVATLFGSSTLGSILGGVLVTTTPVGWVIGSVVLGGTVGYGISKLVRRGGKSDAIKKMNMHALKEKIKELQNQAQHANKPNDKIKKIIEGIQILIKNNQLSQDESTAILHNIEKGSMTVEFAFNTINEILASKTNKNQ